MKLKIFAIVLITGMLFSFRGFSQVGSGTAGNNPLMPVYERPPIYIGPVIGFNRVAHTLELPSFADPICPNFVDGNDNGFYFGLSYEMMFGEAEQSNSSLIFRVLYNTMPTFSETSEDPVPSLVGQNIINSQTRHTLDINYSMITGEVMYKINPIKAVPVGITVGPSFDFVMTKTLDQRYELLNPQNAQFRRLEEGDPDYDKYVGVTYTDNDRTIIIEDGDIPDASGFRLGLKAGIQYEISNVITKTMIVPAIYYNFGVTNLTSGDSWRVNALQMGVDIRYAF